MGEKIILDSNTFKALASRTRLMILKNLDERQKTISELSKTMELNKATIYEHLSLLQEAGLVTKIESGNKWVYYKLTWKGVDLLHPEKKKIVILLSTSLIFLIGSIFSYITTIRNYFVQYTEVERMVVEKHEIHSLSSINVEFISLLQGVVFLLGFAIFFLLTIWLWKRGGKGLLKTVTP